MDYGYTLIGFMGTLPHSVANSANPLFLPNHDINVPNFDPRLKSDPLMQYIEHSRSQSGFGTLWINLPLLYKLKWVHGKIDFYDLCHDGYYKLLDENYENPFKNLPLTNIPLEHPFNLSARITFNKDKSLMYKWLNDGDFLGRSRKDIIIEIEQKYPGLFKPMFINPSVPKPLSPKTPSHSPPQIVVSNKSKKKQSKPPRDVALTKKYRNQRSKQTFPDWWEVKSE